MSVPSTQRAWKVACAATCWPNNAAAAAAMVKDFMAVDVCVCIVISLGLLLDDEKVQGLVYT